LSVAKGNCIFEFLTPLNGLRIIIEEERWNIAIDYIDTIIINFKRLLKYYPNFEEKYKDEIDKIKKYIEEKNAKKCIELIDYLWAEFMSMLTFT